MIDTHCHLSYDGLYERVDEVVAKAHEAGVDRMITVGTTPEDARKALGLAQRFDGIYSTVGLHPHYALECTDQSLLRDAITELASLDEVVALGEMGLDQHYPDPPMDEQRRVLDWQLEIIADLPDGHSDSSGGLPIIIHNREATDETLAVLRRSGIAPGRFVFHCFTGSQVELDRVLDFGAMVSFTGIVTFNNARYLADGAASVPLDRLMVETDSPYLTPEPHRRVRPNEPRYVADVARFLAEQRGMPFDEFVEVMDANAERVFALPSRSAG